MSLFFGTFSILDEPDQSWFEKAGKVINEINSYRIKEIRTNSILISFNSRLSDDGKEVFPLYTKCGNYIIVGHVRLDYRDELGDKLGIIETELSNISDARLVTLSVEKWGLDFVHRLEGDFSILIYDQQKRKIVMFRDKTGYSGLYYSCNGTNLYFSSVSQAFSISTSFEQIPNYFNLALSSFNEPMISRGDTLLKNVSYVDHAEIVCFQNTIINKYKYSNSPKIQKLKYRYEVDYSLDYYYVFSSAIFSRLKNKKRVGMFMSSGLDSAAIFHFVSNYREIADSPTHTYTSVPSYGKLITDIEPYRFDESSYVRQLQAKAKNILPKFLAFDAFSYAEKLQSLKIENLVNPFVNINAHWLDGIIAESDRDKNDILLVGQMGNQTLSWDAKRNLFYHFIQLDFKIFFNDLKGIFLERKHAYELIKINLLQPLKTFLFRSSSLPVTYENDVFDYCIQNLSRVEKKRLIKLIRSQYRTVFYSAEEMHLFYFNRNSTQLSSMLWHEDAAYYGQLISDPTSDERFVDLCFSIPKIMFNKQAIEKYIFKKSFGKFVPPDVLNVDKKALQSCDIHFRMKNDVQLSQVIDFLNSNANLLQLDLRSILSNFITTLNDNNLRTIEKMIFCNRFLKNISIIYFIYKKFIHLRKL